MDINLRPYVKQHHHSILAKLVLHESHLIASSDVSIASRTKLTRKGETGLKCIKTTGGHVVVIKTS
jgi:hypothetical protein